jgi:AcrR family transcriptional regulator
LLHDCSGKGEELASESTIDGGEADEQPRQSKRSKRSAILAAATEEFAKTGYRASRWSDIANAVGIGQTALYHYFVSKEHCLFRIMADALREHRDIFDAAQKASDDPSEVISAGLGHVLEADQATRVRNRVLASELSLLSHDHDGPKREHDAYLEARSYSRDIVRDWTRYLESCMRDGRIPASEDPNLLAHGLLGLGSSVFLWYDPRATDIPAKAVRDSIVAHAMAMTFFTGDKKPQPRSSRPAGRKATARSRA